MRPDLVRSASSRRRALAAQGTAASLLGGLVGWSVALGGAIWLRLTYGGATGKFDQPWETLLIVLEVAMVAGAIALGLKRVSPRSGPGTLLVSGYLAAGASFSLSDPLVKVAHGISRQIALGDGLVVDVLVRVALLSLAGALVEAVWLFLLVPWRDPA